MKYLAYELLSPSAADMGVDTNPVILLQRLAEDINILAEDEAVIELLRVGTIEAGNIDDALNEIRADRLDESFGGWVNASLQD